MAESRRLQKDDLPQQLWPMWDQLEAVAQDMHRQHHRMVRARLWYVLGAGICLGSAAANIAALVLRP